MEAVNDRPLNAATHRAPVTSPDKCRVGAGVNVSEPIF